MNGYRILTFFFLSGLALGMGPCVGPCSLVLLPYIAGTKSSWREALKSWMFFSSGRIFAYLIVGLACGIFGSSVKEFLQRTTWIGTLTGWFIAILGFLLILKSSALQTGCKKICGFFVGRDITSLAVLGALFGFAPCAPFLFLLPVVIFHSGRWFLGPFYMLSFALGTVISPLLLFSIAAGVFPQALLRLERHRRVFSMICGGMLMLFGVFIITGKICL